MRRKYGSSLLVSHETVGKSRCQIEAIVPYWRKKLQSRFRTTSCEDEDKDLSPLSTPSRVMEFRLMFTVVGLAEELVPLEMPLQNAWKPVSLILQWDISTS